MACSWRWRVLENVGDGLGIRKRRLRLDRSSGALKVPHVWVALDPGIAVQPDNIVAQTESSVVYGLGFALSNLASMLALVGYPFVLEPRVATRAQSYGWSAAFIAFALLTATSAWFSLRAPRPAWASSRSFSPSRRRSP